MGFFAVPQVFTDHDYGSNCIRQIGEQHDFHTNHRNPSGIPVSYEHWCEIGTNVSIALGGIDKQARDCGSYECFAPDTVTIHVGDIVYWHNRDGEIHTVTAGTPANGPSGEFDSGPINKWYLSKKLSPTQITWENGEPVFSPRNSNLQSGSHFFHEFDSEGTYPYFCTIHPWMTGTIIVLPGQMPMQPKCDPKLAMPNRVPCSITGEETGDVTWTSASFDGSENLTGVATLTQHVFWIQKLDEYWYCGTTPSNKYVGYHNQDCLQYNEIKHSTGISPTVIADYKIEKDGKLVSTYVVPDGPNPPYWRQQLWDAYRSITPPQIMSEVSHFIMYTDDYGGQEAAVLRSIDDPLKLDISIDPIDAFPSGFYNKQRYIATMIHENAHILSFSANQSDGRGLSPEAYDSAYKYKQEMDSNKRSCAPNYYNDLAGCMEANSYLNAFFKIFWGGIYSDFKWEYEFNDPEKFKRHNDDFYFKYENYWITEYSATNPNERYLLISKKNEHRRA